MEHVCNDCTYKLYPHLTDLAVRQYLLELVSYLDYVDEEMGDIDLGTWREHTEMEHSGI